MSQRRQPTPSYAQKCYTKLETAPFVLQAETTMSNNKILVVEDDADYREMVMLFLRQSGYRAVEAVTGLEAVSRARVTRPNLILMIFISLFPFPWIRPNYVVFAKRLSID